MKTSHTAGIALAVLFMLLFLGALGVRFWASGEATRVLGPDHIAVGSERVYLHVNRELVALSASGEILERRTLDQLGIEDAPIDLRVLQDGRVLIAGQRPASLRLCDPARWECMPVGEGVARELKGQFKIALDEQAGRLLIADFDGDEVWLQPLAGGEPKVLHAARFLKRPNDIALDANGRLWVADSGHRRIVALGLHEDGVREAGFAHDARNGQAREGHGWPMMLAFGPDGNWWVTQLHARARAGGDLLIYHPRIGIRARIPLPDDATPTDVASMGDAMLVTDMDRFRLYRVGVESHEVAEFGGARLRAELRRLADQRARYETLSEQSMIGVIAFAVLMVLAAFLVTPKQKRFTPRPKAAVLSASAAQVPPLGGVYWLKRNPKTDRLVCWTLPISFVLVAFVLGSMFGMAYYLDPTLVDGTNPDRAEKAAEFRKMLFMSVFVFGGLPVLTLFTSRNVRPHLGTDGHRLFVRYPDGRQASFAPEQLVYGSRQIAYRDQAFSIQLGNQNPLYVEGEVETYVAPLLRRAKRLSGLAMFRHLLAQREAGTLATMVYSAMVIGIMLATGMWRHILS